MPIKKTDLITEFDPTTSDKLPSLSSDTVDTTIRPMTRNSKKRKTTGDNNNEEHIVPKRKVYGKRRKGIHYN